MWLPLELSFETPYGTLLLILLGLLAFLCLLYALVSWRQQQRALESLRRERYEAIVRHEK